MKQKFIILILSLIISFNFQSKSHAIPIGPIKNIIVELVEKIPAFFDDLFKRGKNIDEAVVNNSSREIDNLGVVLKDQDIILNKISNETHNNYINSLKNNSNENIALNHGVRITKTATKKSGKISEKIADLFDFDFSYNEEIKIEPYIIKSWVGKIYKNSSYFNQPKYEERMLLICKDESQIFYFSVILNNQNDINRAYLTDQININNNMSNFKKQELLILLDEEETKIMSTKPLLATEAPGDYFVIKSNQLFEHIKNSDPEAVLRNNKKSRSKRQFDNKCYKAKLDGIVF
jgi:ribosomal protein S17E